MNIDNILSEPEFSSLQLIINFITTQAIPYHITGGFAGNFYASQHKLHDIDIDLSRDNIQVVQSRFNKYVVRPLSPYQDEEFDIYLMTLKIAGLSFDFTQTEEFFLMTKTGKQPISHDLARAKDMSIRSLNVKVQPLDDIIAYKKLMPLRQNDVSELSDLSRLFL